MSAGGSHVLPELHQLLQWSYTQAPGQGSNEEFSWIHHKDRHHHAPFSDLSEDIRAFMNQLKAVFLTRFYCLMTQLRGSATLSPCHIKSWEWVKKQNLLILMKEQCWDLRKLTIRDRKTLIMILCCWVRSLLQCPHTWSLYRPLIGWDAPSLGSDWWRPLTYFQPRIDQDHNGIQWIHQTSAVNEDLAFKQFLMEFKSIEIQNV